MRLGAHHTLIALARACGCSDAIGMRNVWVVTSLRFAISASSFLQYGQSGSENTTSLRSPLPRTSLMSLSNGKVFQSTTTASRIGAYLGPVTHWIYFTPIRKHVPEPETWQQAGHTVEKKPGASALFQGRVLAITLRTTLVCALGLSAWWLFLFWQTQHLRGVLTEAKVPAREAGVLVELRVREGDAVTAGETIARIDDSQPRFELRKAKAEHDQAAAKAESDVDVRFSVASERVAAAEFEKAQLANEKLEGSVTRVELDRLELNERKAELQIEQAEQIGRAHV